MHEDRSGVWESVRWGIYALWEAWMLVVGAFSWLLARVATVVVFVVGFVPYGLVMRLTGFDPLDRELDDRDSYWTPVEGSNDDIESFRRQY